MPHLTADNPQPTPFTVEDFPWQLNQFLSDRDRQERYRDEEAERLIPDLYVDGDFQLSVLHRVKE